MNTAEQFDDEYHELIRKHQNLMHNFIFAIYPEHAAADDIRQETNRVLWEKRHQFRLGTNFPAWCREIAHFQTLRYLKQNQRKSWLRFDSDLVHTLAEAFEDGDEERERRESAIKTCIQALSAEDQQMVKMRYELMMSQREISEKTKRTEGALKQVFLRIRKKLRQCVERKVTTNLD